MNLLNWFKEPKKPLATNNKNMINYEPFYETICHPRKKILARKLVEGADPESFYEDYGSVRVSEMQSTIRSYEKDTERYLKGHQLAGCKTCGI